MSQLVFKITHLKWMEGPFPLKEINEIPQVKAEILSQDNMEQIIQFTLDNPTNEDVLEVAYNVGSAVQLEIFSKRFLNNK